MSLLERISLEPVFGWWALVPVALIMIASLWLTLSSAGLSKSQRTTLAALRLGAMLILLLGWLRPGFISEQTRESEAAVAVLMDRSQSMTLPSDTNGLNRWQVQQQVWEELVAFTNLSLGQTKIVPYFYDQEPQAAVAEDLPELEQTFANEPAGRSTDLGRALSQVARLQVDPPLRGVIIMGDATQTAIPPGADPSMVARQMAQLDQPVFMVGIGAPSDKSQLSDVAIEGLPEQYSAFVKKELGVRLVVHAKSMQNQPITIQLKLRASGEADRIVASRQLLASRADELLPQDFNIVLPEEGEYLLEATVSVDANDQIESNNTALSFISVREGGAKILYLEGQPRQEQLFLKRALNESLDFDVQYRWLPEREVQRGPRNLTEEIQFRDYDAIIIGDLDASAFSSETQRAIADRVQAGAGILFMGGYHSFDAGGYGRSRILEPLFPTRLTQRSQAFGTDIDPSFHLQGKIPLLPTRPHPITNLLPEPDNTRLWQQLPPMLGMNRLGPTKVGPGIQVLLESPQREPALVTGQFGNGRVLAFAANSTWRWWLAGQSKVSRQFWRQALLWMIRRDTLSEGFRMELESRRLLIDDTPELQIQWFGGSDNKPMPTNVNIELSRDGQRLQRLPASPTGDNSQTAKITGLSQPGLYRATLQASADDGSAYETDFAFIVRDESRELARPDADWQMMKNIVSANQAAGGMQILPDEIEVALAALKQRQEASKVTIVEKRRLGDAAWDSWLYLILFCVLLSIEWALRKSWQLP
ncbi:MAG: glutamine amidotransferase [bacterium]|nr:glutamine amidotransferase [bacterium]